MVDRNFNRTGMERPVSSSVIKWVQKNGLKRASRKTKLLAEVAQLKEEIASFQRQNEPVSLSIVRDVLQDLVGSAVTKSEAVKPSSLKWMPTFESISQSANREPGNKPAKKYCYIKVRILNPPEQVFLN